LDYAACREALERAEADLTAAEFHGTLCAMLCTRSEVRLEAWVDEIVCGGQLPEGGGWSRVLHEHGERSHRALIEGDFELELLLPGDEEPLDERSRALSDWCKGFLYGLGTAGRGVTECLSEDAREVVSDLTEFTRLDTEEESSESAEKAFAEIVEYLRVGVLLIYEELARARAGAPGRSRLH